jgi:hypothetical protein
VEPKGSSDIGGFAELKKANVDILDNAVKAVEIVCPRLSFWTLQTGGKVCTSMKDTPWEGRVLT